ncbi:MAG TPA: hypothetical protein VM842_03310, partial [Nitrospira sp.]|nr:hypothetical protein [Nitrospira sp.]
FRSPSWSRSNRRLFSMIGGEFLGIAMVSKKSDVSAFGSQAPKLFQIEGSEKVMAGDGHQFVVRNAAVRWLSRGTPQDGPAARAALQWLRCHGQPPV